MQKPLSCLLVLLLLWASAGVPLAAREPAGRAAEPTTLPGWVEQPYVVVFDRAPELNWPAREIEAFRKQLEQEKRRERDALRQQQRSIQNQIKQTQNELRGLDRAGGDGSETERRRHGLHCQIESLRKQEVETRLALEHGLNTTYDNKLAKLRILEEWPRRYAEIRRQQGTELAARRKFGDFRDIGYRNGDFAKQADDVQLGRNAYEELKHRGLLPPEVEDEAVVSYVRDLATRIARHSDLQVPLQVFVLKSREINAFALPGGLLFVNTGLILKADKESELAGVIAHEIAHSAARHGRRLMKRATIAGIIFQAAQIAALIFTGGIATLGAYYALQYGFFGLGLVLDLALLGVSRDYEIEADILGTQYLWNAGYNTKGFVSFFDKMAQEKGYVTGLSWFRTHPPFYERMAETYQEIILLPEQKEAVDDSSDFQAAKNRLQDVVREMERRDRDAPTLRPTYQCEEEPQAR